MRIAALSALMITLSFFSAAKKNHSTDLVPPHSFTSGIEGPAFDKEGNLYVVNYLRQGTIGKIDKSGKASLYLTLPGSSVGNGIQFGRTGDMYIADYVNHTIFRKKSGETTLTIFSHEPAMNQPNDLVITDSGMLFASDPDWENSKGQLWRIAKNGKATLIEADMGTTNGIALSPDNRFLYVNESVQRKVWKYSLSSDGNVSNKTLLHEFTDHGLDGMQCDSKGNLYIARYGAGEVAVLAPSGELSRVINLQGQYPTNIALHEGENITVYVTMQKRGTVEVLTL